VSLDTLQRSFVIALRIYEMCIFTYAILSWFTGLGSTAAGLYRLLAIVCEPFVGLLRRLLPRQMTGGGGFDLSPLAAMIVLILAQRLIEGL
jgi:YggT family protein